MKKGVLFFLLVVGMVSLHAKNLVLSFDNLPIENTRLMRAQQKTAAYLAALEEHKVKTVFFAIGHEISVADSTQYACIEQVCKAGHRIANHTFTHPHLSPMEVDDYVADILQCEKWILPFATYAPWFRHPYLDVGLEPSIGGTVLKGLTCAMQLYERGFLNGYVTIDSYDWFINSLLLEAAEEGIEYTREDLIAFYLKHLKYSIARYLSYKSEEENRLFSTHVLLLHANDLNALCLSEMMTMLKEEGWNLVEPEVAFSASNPLSDFPQFIHFKILQMTMDTPRNLHSAEKTRREFQAEVLHLTE